jgi:alkylated DNA repair protein (DNA oxidative demethylase)
MTIYHEKLITHDKRASMIAEIGKLIKDAPWFVPVMKSGATFRYCMSNAGKYGWVSDQKGYRYVEENPQTGRPWPKIPNQILAIIQELAEKGIIPKDFQPESMLINKYLKGESLGLHQDNSEKNQTAPIVSVSLGSPGIFFLGGLKRRDAVKEILLEPGDIFVMSGDSRMRFHGFKGITKGEKRINLTIRQVY